MGAWAFIALGIAAGVLSGLFGIGGGILLVPALMMGFGFAPHMATGTSLVALLLPVGILGVWEYYRSGKIGIGEVQSGLWIGLGIFLGAWLGARLALFVEGVWLKRIFACFMVLVAIKLWLARD